MSERVNYDFHEIEKPAPVMHFSLAGKDVWRTVEKPVIEMYRLK